MATRQRGATRKNRKATTLEGTRQDMNKTIQEGNKTRRQQDSVSTRQERNHNATRVRTRHPQARQTP